MSHFTKRLIIFVIIFTIICLGITTILILEKTEKINIGLSSNSNTTNNPVLSDIPDYTQIESDELGVKTVTDKYKANGLTLTTINYHEGEEIFILDDYSIYNTEITYLEIFGLKDKTIQDKINSEIKEMAFSLLVEDEQNDPNIYQIEISAEITANFSNILSVSFSKFIQPASVKNLDTEEQQKKYDAEYEKYNPDTIIGLNFDLQTGNQISFSELFTNDAATKNIISQAAYNSFAKEYMKFDGTTDMNNVDYSSIEDRILKLLVNYDRNKNYSFYFSEKIIYAEIEDEMIEINMKDFYTQIAIYNRFISDTSLYENDSFNNLIVFSNNYSDFYTRNEKIDENLFIVIWGWSDEDLELSYSDKQKCVEKINKKIDETKEYLNDNPDKAILFYIRCNFESVNGEIEIVNTVIRKSIMSKEYYTSTYLDYILDTLQGPDVGSPSIESFEYIDEQYEKYITLEEEDIDVL